MGFETCIDVWLLIHGQLNLYATPCIQCRFIDMILNACWCHCSSSCTATSTASALEIGILPSTELPVRNDITLENDHRQLCIDVLRVRELLFLYVYRIIYFLWSNNVLNVTSDTICLFQFTAHHHALCFVIFLWSFRCISWFFMDLLHFLFLFPLTIKWSSSPYLCS